MAKLIIGLTSGIAGGKNVAAKIFSQHGVETVDADEISHQLTALGSPFTEEIIRHFGEDYRQQDGSLNRRQLRNRIFTRPEDRQWLESLLHPPLQVKLAQLLSKCQSPYGLLVSPLILESSQSHLCHKIIVIKIAEDIQIMRACERDKISKEEARAIIATQMPLSRKIKQANYILDNNGTPQELAEQVSRLHRELIIRLA